MDESDFECSICLCKREFYRYFVETLIVGILSIVLLISATLQPPIRTTLCGHNFCQTCLIDATQGQSNWNCPECRRRHENTVEFYGRNHLLEKLVGKLNTNFYSGQNDGVEQRKFKMIPGLSFHKFILHKFEFQKYGYQ